jgi:inhibitor of cysteine peptidase
MNTQANRFRQFIILVLFSMLLAGCGGAKAGGVQLTDGDNGKEILAKKGETVSVRLEANPTTGFGWEVSEVDAQMLAQNGEKTYEQANSSKNLVGGGGWETFTFTAQQTGETTLKLIYHRSWEKGVDPAKTFEVKIRIDG